MNLSRRMEAVVNMVSPQSSAIADVGCDHAYVSIALAKQNQVCKVVAMDVRPGPIAIAKENIQQSGLHNVIDLRMGDGLEQLSQNEVDTIIIAGMGGLLIKGILQRGNGILQVAQPPVLILQPQSEIYELRSYLLSIGYIIEKEDYIVEEGKFYTIIRACYSEMANKNQLNTVALTYGLYGLESRNPILLQHLQREYSTLSSIEEKLSSLIASDTNENEEVPEKTVKRYNEILEQIRINKAALAYYD